MNLKDITLRQYIEFHKEYDEDLTEREQTALIQKHFFNNVHGIDKMSYRKIAKMTENFSGMFLASEKEPLTIAFKIDGVEYGFIPDLEGMTFEEIMDIDMYLPEVELHNRLMAVLYRPITKVGWARKWGIGKKYRTGQYNIASYNGTDGFADIMLDMPLNVYFGALSFFGHLGTVLRAVFPSYLEQQIATTSQPQDKYSDSDGNGISH